MLGRRRESRLGLVTRQLQLTLCLAGEKFTAAGISVVHALELARRDVVFVWVRWRLPM